MEIKKDNELNEFNLDGYAHLKDLHCSIAGSLAILEAVFCGENPSIPNELRNGLCQTVHHIRNDLKELKETFIKSYAINNGVK